MNSHTTSTQVGDLRYLATFVAFALPVGWVLLSVPLVTDLPVEPFVLATLVLGLVAPAVVLTRRDPHASLRSLLADTVRMPRPWWLLFPAGLLIPVAVGLAAAVLGVGTEPSTSELVNLAVANILTSLVIVNLWEEMAWAGFVQRRATARWGFLAGAVVTALLFTAIHLPLSLYGADSLTAIGYNVAGMLVAGIGLRLLIGAFDSWGRGSILALGLVHATFNASSELVDASYDWVRYATVLGLGVAALALGAATRERQDREVVTPAAPRSAAR